MAIKWNNVSGAAPSAALTQGIQASRGGIGDSLRDLGALVGEEGDRQDDGRVNALMQRLQSFKSPEEVTAFEQSAEGQDMVASITRGANQREILGAGDNRRSALMEQLTQQQAFAVDQETYGDREGLAQIRNRISENSGIGDDALRFVMNEEANKVSDTGRATVSAENALAVAGREAVAQKNKIDEGTLGVGQRNAGTNAFNAHTNSQREKADNVRLTTANYQLALDDRTALIASTMESEGAVGAVMTGVADIVPEEDREEVAAILGQITLSNPKYGDIPQNVMVDIVAAHAGPINDWLGRDSTGRADMTEAMNSYLTANPDLQAIRANKVAEATTRVESALVEQKLSQERYNPRGEAQIEAAQAKRDARALKAANKVQQASDEKALKAFNNKTDSGPLSTGAIFAPDSPKGKAVQQLGQVAADSNLSPQDEIDMLYIARNNVDSNALMPASARTLQKRLARESFNSALKPVGNALKNLSTVVETSLGATQDRVDVFSAQIEALQSGPKRRN